MKFRHEWKHEISYVDFLAIQSRLSAVMQRDPHAVNGSYAIRSLYFDNLRDKALREKLDGVNGREKFRLRYYNGDTSYLLLEKKSKINGLCSKEQTVLTRKEAELSVAGDWDALEASEKPLLRELRRKMLEQGLRATTLVDYTRHPFVYAPGNVRVTLDHDLHTGLRCTDFLNPRCVTIPAGDSPILLEVKWDAYLPGIIRDIVQLPDTHTAAFSKYALCRIYG